MGSRQFTRSLRLWVSIDSRLRVMRLVDECFRSLQGCIEPFRCRTGCFETKDSLLAVFNTVLCSTCGSWLHFSCTHSAGLTILPAGSKELPLWATWKPPGTHYDDVFFMRLLRVQIMRNVRFDVNMHGPPFTFETLQLAARDFVMAYGRRPEHLQQWIKDNLKMSSNNEGVDARFAEVMKTVSEQVWESDHMQRYTPCPLKGCNGVL